MGKLIPVFLVLLGLGAGVGAGLFLRPPPAEPDEEQAEKTTAPVTADIAGLELYEFPSQFMVPLVVDGRIAHTVVLRVALEFTGTEMPFIESNAPRLRDALLQVMFDHANAGGFQGTFTDNATLTHLRRALLEAAQKLLGADVARGVLITELLRVGS